ncbi:MAG: helix-turn-helix domain-containing protein [Pseudomonadota bacterium]|nr:helix-turn-helix domain-containing protein [Pseudomonadota bacterium]
MTPFLITRRGEGPNPIDVHVGKRLRLYRTRMNITQDKLAEAVGVTFQQMQKYERGANRISASKLYQLAAALELSSVSDFYKGMDGQSSDYLPDNAYEAGVLAACRKVPEDLREKTVKIIDVMG